MQIYNNSQNSYAPQFGAIKGSPKAIVDKLGDKAIDLILDQKQNKAADVVFDYLGNVKVEVKDKRYLPADMKSENITEFEPQYRDWRDGGFSDFYDAKGHKVSMFAIGETGKTKNTLVDVCVHLADEARALAGQNKKADDATLAKVIGALMNLKI